MRADDIRLLFDYSYAATQRILDTAEQLDDGTFTDTPPLQGLPSARDILVHILDAEQGWRYRLTRDVRESEPDLDPAAYPTIAVFADAWHTNEREMRE